VKGKDTGVNVIWEQSAEESAGHERE